ncbi:VCBS repeat-containing protein, partial [Moorena sp. SIO2C4]|uniref:FG-GAP repeat domain-containing protein n=1 Tax=Moorena sp. SIO2C4 TaxID=2607824 RepID=UPI0013C65D9E
MGLIQVVYGLTQWMQKNDFSAHDLLKITSGAYVDKIDFTKGDTILNKWGRSQNNLKTTSKVIPMKIASFLTIIFLLLSFIFDSSFVYADEMSSHWNPHKSYIPPTDIAADGYGDQGVRLIDLNGDGLLDMVQNRYISSSLSQTGAWINHGESWSEKQNNYIPPTDIAADGYGDQGVRLIDLNGDGLLD